MYVFGTSIFCVINSGCSSVGGKVLVDTAPAAPIGVSIDYNVGTISWSAPPSLGEDTYGKAYTTISYVVKQATNDQFSENLQTTVVDQNQYTIPDFQYGIKYYISLSSKSTNNYASSSPKVFLVIKKSSSPNIENLYITSGFAGFNWRIKWSEITESDTDPNYGVEKDGKTPLKASPTNPIEIERSQDDGTTWSKLNTIPSRIQASDTETLVELSGNQTYTLRLKVTNDRGLISTKNFKILGTDPVSPVATANAPNTSNTELKITSQPDIYKDSSTGLSKGNFTVEWRQIKETAGASPNYGVEADGVTPIKASTDPLVAEISADDGSTWKRADINAIGEGADAFKLTASATSVTINFESPGSQTLMFRLRVTNAKGGVATVPITTITIP